jgi:hypothetical protein
MIFAIAIGAGLLIEMFLAKNNLSMVRTTIIIK